LLYRVNLNRIQSVKFAPFVTKEPETRIFPIDMNIFEIHFCLIDYKQSIYELHLHFPGKTMKYPRESSPMLSFILCAEVEDGFHKIFKRDSSFQIFGEGNFVLPDVITVPFEDLFEMNYLFSSIREKLKYGISDIESLKYILRKINHTSWEMLACASYSYFYVIDSFEYIYKNYKEKINVLSLAEEFLLSPNYLNRLYREITGKSIKEVIDIVRASSAREELFYSNKSLPQLALSNGFSTRKSMVKIFHYLFQMSPEECRSLDRNTRISPLPFENCMMELLFKNFPKKRRNA